MVNVQFNEVDDKHTTVKFAHSRWEAFTEKAEDIRNGYNQGWVGVFACTITSAAGADRSGDGQIRRGGLPLNSRYREHIIPTRSVKEKITTD